MPKIVFLLQDRGLAASVRDMTAELTQQGQAVEVISMDPVMHQNVATELPASALPVASPVAFYRMSHLARARWLIGVRQRVQSIAADADLLVISCDGAVQRIVAKAVKSRGGRVVMAYDGIVHPPDSVAEAISRRVRVLMLRFAERIGLDYLAPGVVGMSDMDGVFVTHPAVGEEFRRRGVIAPVESVVFPRLAELQRRVATDRSAEVRWRILYATGAFDWHGRQKEAAWQRQEVLDLIEYAAARPRCEVRVRVHPRESIDGYRALSIPFNVSITDSSVDLTCDLAWAGTVVTARSSVVLEAGLCGIRCAVTAIRFPEPHPVSFLSVAEHARIIHDFEELRWPDDFQPYQPTDVTFSQSLAQALLKELELL